MSVPDAGPAVLEVVRLLDSGGFDPESIMVREPTLDDVFLELTGHKAESQTSQPDDETKAPGRSGRGVRGAA